jgi:hypothetical protein
VPEPLTIKTATAFFFDSANVAKATTRMERKALSKIGAFIRTRARGSMKPAGKKGKVSRPGEPPRVRKGFLKRFLYFVYVPETRSVVVGPAGFASRKGRPVPGLLEAGGTVQLDLVRLSGGLVIPAKSRLAQRSDGEHIRSRNRLEARPYMRPAYEAELPKFAGQFAGEFNNGG